jgi:hypothetical protein
MPFFRGEADQGPRREIFYFDDNANLNALRYDDWKISFAWIERIYSRAVGKRKMCRSSRASEKTLSSATMISRACMSAGGLTSYEHSFPCRQLLVSSFRASGITRPARSPVPST